MKKSVRLSLIVLLLLLIIPHSSLRAGKKFSPEEAENWPKIFEAIKNSSENAQNIRNEAKIRPALILGLLNQESSYGKNIGKTENEWEDYCEKEGNKGKESCIYWKAYDCKLDYSNAAHFQEIYTGLSFNREEIPTSFTCALGFTQFEPNTWWDIKERHKEDTLSNPWVYYDSILACSYKLKEDGAPENEIGALTKYYGASNYEKYIDPILNTAQAWEDNFLEPTAKTFCKTPNDFLCALEKLKEVSKSCCKAQENCNLYKIKEELKTQILKEEKRLQKLQPATLERPFSWWQKISDAIDSTFSKIKNTLSRLNPFKQEAAVEEKSLLKKIKDATNETFASISSTITENFSKLKENLVQLNPFKKEIPIGRYENIDDEKDFVELKEDRTFYSEQAFNFAIKGYGMKYETGFTLASSGKYVIQGSKITFKIKRLISGGFEMELPGIFSTKCRLVENGFDCEDGTQYRKIKKKEKPDLLKETGPAVLVPPLTEKIKEKPKEEPSTGIIGTVYYSKTPLSGIKIKILLNNINTQKSILNTVVKSNEQGQFLIFNIPPGEYSIHPDHFDSPSEYVGSIEFSSEKGGNIVEVMPNRLSKFQIHLQKNLILISPPDNTIITDTTPTFAWKSFPETVQYKVDIWDEENHELVFEETSIISTNYTVSKKLTPDKNYSWTIWGLNDENHSIAYGSRKFTISSKIESKKTEIEKKLQQWLWENRYSIWEYGSFGYALDISINDYAIKDELIWAVGYLHGIGGYGRILHSSDGGDTWEVQWQSSTYGPDPFKVEFLDKKEGWVATNESILHTTDGGGTWNTLSPPPYTKGLFPEYIRDFGVIDKHHLWVRLSNGEIYESLDGGESWQIQK